MASCLLGGLFGLGLALLVASGAWQFGEIDRLLDHNDVWAHGERAAGSRVKGKSRTSRFILNDYELEVEYVDRKGARHAAPLPFSTRAGVST